jgi:kinesin family protein 3/17
MVRIRPPLIRELEENESFISTIQVSDNRKRLCLYEYHNIEQVPSEQLEEFLEDPNNFSMNNFQFDNVYD